MKIRMLVTRKPHISGEVYDVPEDVAKRYLFFREAEEVIEAAVMTPPETAARPRPKARRSPRRTKQG